jgi:hypothetical protein
MGYKITVGDYVIQAIDSVSITKSVENLADKAVIVIAGTYMNRAIRVEDKIQEGDPVEIRLGYDDDLKMEFSGYLNAIVTDDAAIQLECEDALYLFRKPLPDKEYKNITLDALLQIVVDEVNARNASQKTPTHYAINSDFHYPYDKFVFSKTTAFDVLKKVQEETGANIYFKDEILHIHEPYSKIFNTDSVIFDFSRNIEKSSLKYVLFKNKKLEVVVNFTGKDGKTNKQTYGTPGGEKKEFKNTDTNEEAAKIRAKGEYNLFAIDGYEGNFTGWLLPFVEPAYKIRLQDKDYPYKNGNYYVVAVDTKFSSSGGSRVVTLGKKIG